MLDHKFPHELLRVRLHGSVLVAQPYSGSQRYGKPLVVDMETGNIGMGEKMVELAADYTIVHAIIGVLRLRTCVAVAVVTSAEAVAKVATHNVYKVTATKVLIASGRKPHDKGDARLVSLLTEAVSPLGAGLGLYFATTTNVTNSLQRTHGVSADKPLWQRSNSDFWFNAFLSEPLCHAGADQFVMPCILGFVRQMTGVRVKSGARSESLTVSLIARRSRFRAGTRHWRRGIDGQGNVANFVESEQVAEAEGAGDISAFVQLRGSIPACWSQVPNSRYKPPTVIADDASVAQGAFAKHAKYLASRYGTVTAINLSNQHGSEGRLCQQYQQLADGVRGDTAFNLVPFDFHKECGKTSYENLEKLWKAVAPAAEEAGAFRTKGELGRVSAQQRGAARTNCIDCLDRTNVVQALLARRALEAFLHSLLLLEKGKGLADTFPLEQRFKIIWADHGDMLSAQYAGTGALKSGFTRTGKRTIGGLVDDGVKSAVRYYLNNYEDGHKQDAFDLVCGTFKPRQASEETCKSAGSNGSVWVIMSVTLLMLALLTGFLAPFSRRIALLTSTLPLLLLSAATFAVVLAIGTKSTCRPRLRPDLVQPWLPASKPVLPQAARKQHVSAH